MKLYNRADFIKLPSNTVYSRVNPKIGALSEGLFIKESAQELVNDWLEQDLINSPEIKVIGKYPDWSDIYEDPHDRRDRFDVIRLDYDLCGRDGMFEDSDLFLVWDSVDVQKLIDKLKTCL